MSTSPTRSIRTSTPQTTCDVCGRTLLRGERAEAYLSGGTRHSVCDLCTSRALHGGWVREGTEPELESASSREDRRRSLFGRRRSRRGAEIAEAIESGPPAPPAFGTGEAPLDLPPLGLSEEIELPRAAGPAPEWPDSPPREERRSRRRRRAPAEAVPARDSSGPREPRHVRAVPTSIEHKIEAAIELFNGSEHPRRVAGIARSLGLPDVSVHPADPVASLVNVTVWWELCWYRYELDLSDEVPSVRATDQGYEVGDLTELERRSNAVADENGRLQVDAGAGSS